MALSGLCKLLISGVLLGMRGHNPLCHRSHLLYHIDSSGPLWHAASAAVARHNHVDVFLTGVIGVHTADAPLLWSSQ